MRNELYFSGYSDAEISIIGWKEGAPFWTEKAVAPSYIAFGDGMLFSVEERDQGGAVCLYCRTGEKWKLSDRRVITGGSLCHIVYSNRHHCLLGACYGSGEVFSLSVDPSEGKFGSMNSYLRQGKGEAAALGATRAHCVVLDKEQQYVCSANIAQDKIYLYKLEDGKLEEKHAYLLPKRCGPRHIALREDMKKAYIITEYSNEIIVASYDDGSTAAILQRISTLDDNYHGESYGSTLQFSPDGKFLYAGNRGENSIAVFSVSRTGRLVLSSRQSCFGDWPRDFSLIENGEKIAIANQRSGNVVICRRDSKTGEISEPIEEIQLSDASCVKEYQGV